MPVYRVERTRDYTVISNHHLKNKKLTLKAKGLLSIILSLPDNWIYSLRGLEYICLEKIDSIRNAMKELEREGYITRSRERDGQGKYRGTLYIIREQPISEKPTLENPAQLNTNKENIDHLSNTYSIPFKSPERGKVNPESNRAEMTDLYEQLIKENIEYDILSQRLDNTRLDDIVTLMVETVCTKRETVRVASDDFPAEVVKSKLLKLDSSHIEFIFDCLNENTTKIRSIKQYLLATLFNAPNTMDSYYSSLVNHHMNGGH